MSSFLSEYLRQIGRSFAATALLGGALLLIVGEPAHFGALLAGAAAAGLYFWQLARRLLRASRSTVAAGRVQVQLGLLVMLALIFAVLWAARTMGAPHLYAAIGGFFLLHALMMTQLIVREMRSDKQHTGDSPQGR